MVVFNKVIVSDLISEIHLTVLVTEIKITFAIICQTESSRVTRSLDQWCCRSYEVGVYSRALEELPAGLRGSTFAGSEAKPQKLTIFPFVTNFFIDNSSSEFPS